MSVHLIIDNANKASVLRSMIEQRHVVTSEMLTDASIKHSGIEAVVIAIDITAVENISALKAISKKLVRIPRRVFLIDARGRLAIVQAYALGATHVLTNPVNQGQLLAKLSPVETSLVASGAISRGGMEAASAGAASIASMFSAVMNRTAIDIKDAKDAGASIAGSIAEHGLSRLARDGAASR